MKRYDRKPLPAADPVKVKAHIAKLHEQGRAVGERIRETLTRAGH